MYVSRLILNDVRNIHRLDLAFDAHAILFYGPNAAGKTSILESLYYLATTRSPRVSLDRELIRWDTPGQDGAPPFARMSAEVRQAKGSVRLEVIVKLKDGSTPGPDETPPPSAPSNGSPGSSGSQKLVRINQKPARSLDLVGLLRVVLFTPTDVILVQGPPGERRRYLDIMLSQLDHRYMRALSLYHRLVQQRNSMLRAWREQRRPARAVDTELDYWDQELSKSGGYLVVERLRAVADLNTLAGPLYASLTGGSQPLALSYQSSIAPDLDHTTNPVDLAQHMRNTFRTLRHDEIKRGQTLIGPHRDDLLLTVDARNLGVYGSRGQQRCVALALKLGEAALMRMRSGEPPVLLLDDVLGELDMQRRAHVLQTVVGSDQQTFLTATDLSDFDVAFLQHAHCLRVEDGVVYR